MHIDVIDVHALIYTKETRMLDTNIKQQLKGYLEKLVNPIELVSYTDDSQASQQTIEFCATWLTYLKKLY